jgi:hypothetical protein
MVRKSQWRKNVDWIGWQTTEEQGNGKFNKKKIKRNLEKEQSNARREKL